MTVTYKAPVEGEITLTITESQAWAVYVILNSLNGVQINALLDHVQDMPPGIQAKYPVFLSQDIREALTKRFTTSYWPSSRSEVNVKEAE